MPFQHRLKVAWETVYKYVDNTGGSGGGGTKCLLASCILPQSVLQSKWRREEIKGGGGTNNGKNLHGRHPVRYPKRSSDEDSDGIDEGNGADTVAAGAFTATIATTTMISFTNYKLR